MIYLLLSSLIFSHTLAILPFLRHVRQGLIPDVIDFAMLSFIIYYDIEILLEICGFSYQSDFFFSFLEADSGKMILAIAILTVAPWLIKLGAFLDHCNYTHEEINLRSSLERYLPIMINSNKKIFNLLDDKEN